MMDAERTRLRAWDREPDSATLCLSSWRNLVLAVLTAWEEGLECLSERLRRV